MKSIREIAYEALRIASDADRDAFITRECSSDPPLRDAIYKMMREIDSNGANYVGRRIGDYELHERLGEGGMGVVYRATQTQPVRRAVAIKLLPPYAPRAEILRRFELEGRVLAALKHVNIASLFDAGTTDMGEPYFVMELVDGGTPLDVYCDSHQLSVSDRIRLFLAVCDGVRHAHAKLIIHRDLKPSNILVGKDGQPKIIDFGIARVINAELSVDTVTPTRPEHRVLTPAYASPEHARGESANPSMDIYSLGVVLYELLTGRRPYKVSSLGDVERVISDQDPTPPSQVVRTPHVARDAEGNERIISAEDVGARRGSTPRSLSYTLSGDLDTIVLKALARVPQQQGSRVAQHRPDQRYETVEQFAADIERYQHHQPIIARPPSIKYRLKKWARRHRSGVILTCVVLLAAAAALTFEWRTQRAALQLQLAQSEAARDRDRAISASVLLQRLVLQATPQHIPDPAIRDVIVSHMITPVGQYILEQRHPDPLVQCDLQAALCDAYRQLGRSDLAIPHAQDAARILARERGRESEQCIRADNLVGLLFTDTGRAAEANGMLKDTVDRATSMLGRTHPTRVTCLNNYAQTLIALGFYAEAEPLAKEVLEQCRTTSDLDTDLVLHALNNYAEVAIYLGHYEDAEPLMRASYEHYMSERGPEHPFTIVALGNMGLLQWYSAHATEAVNTLEDAAARAERVLGSNHPRTLSIKNSLAGVLLNAAQVDRAIPLLREVREARTQQLGSRHLNTLATSHLFASALRRIGRLEEAEPILRQALQERSEQLGLQNARCLDTLSEYSILLRQLARLDEAERVSRLTMTLSKKVQGIDHPDTIVSMSNLGRLLYTSGKEREAEPLLREALERARNNLHIGPKHAITKGVATHYGRCLERLGNNDEADRIRQMYQITLPTTAPATQPIASNVALVDDEIARFVRSLLTRAGPE